MKKMILVCVILVLSACGQSGKLYLPDCPLAPHDNNGHEYEEANTL